jgi:hypothetical protein
MRFLLTFLILNIIICDVYTQTFTYSTDFGTTSSGTPPNPWVIGSISPASVTNSGWTGGNIIFSGTTGGSYANNTSNGNGTFTLSLNSTLGNLSISSISFIARRTSTGPTSIMVDVNGTNFTVSGAPGNGTFSPISASGSVTNIVGNFTINISSSGGSGTNQNIRIDDILINGILPIKVKSFDVVKTNSTTKLMLTTSSETNNDFFTIERSIDGAEFDAIGEIKGAGNSSSELTYEFIDENPLPGINYYRVKQTDFDGKYSYTEIKSVRHHVGKITISPLRTNGRLQITSTQDNYDVALYNAAGQEVFRKNTLNGDQTIDIESLEAGIYFVKIVDQTFKIIKY